jgi:hypothetical protein
MQEYDRSSKWLIQHHGDSILRLAGVRDIVSWRPLQAEVVQPRQLPDGLLHVQLAGEPEEDLFILELATYPEPRLAEQILRDLTLVYLDRRALPEVVALVLHPKGSFRADEELVVESRRGLTRWQVRWRVVRLWTVPAEELLKMQDVGLIPWVPLTSSAEPPEVVLRQCRERIDQQASADERENLLAVTFVLASLRYNDPHLLGILGGKQAMLEFPAIQELMAEVKQRAILTVLKVRFGIVPQEVVEAVQAVSEESKLEELLQFAACCHDLEAFRQRVQG